jgi:hypothetical protein
MTDKDTLNNKKINLFSYLVDDNSDNDDNEELYSSKMIKEKKKINNNNNQNNFNQNNSNQNNSNKNNYNNIKSIEDEVFKKYYGRKEIRVNKPIKKNVQNVVNEPNEFITISNKKSQKLVIECVYKNLEDNILELNMPNYFRVLAHHNDDKNWDYLSYHNIITMQKWIDVPKFLNTLNVASGECKYTDFDIFIMKNEISPMWEDSENRNGSICSIKIDSLDDAYSLLKLLIFHMVNNTLVKFSPVMWDIVNGLSYSSKIMDHLNLNSYCVILKIWFKINVLNHGTIEKLLNDEISQIISKYSIKMKIIKPEY